MVSFAWEESFSVGIDMMDHQHRQIFLCMNLIYGIGKNTPGEDAERHTAELLTYVKAHCFDEERLMEDMEYPVATAHRRQHDLFVAQAERIRQQTAASLPEAVIALRNWFVNHILTEDMHYSEFFLRKYRPDTEQ